ncbi:MAG: hypothetical protein ACXVCF_01985 [Isosphaeraceae bacterium]
MLAMVVFAVTDERNSEAPPGGLAPVFIGLPVSALISVIAPILGATIGSGLYVHVLRTPNPAGDDKDASLHG